MTPRENLVSDFSFIECNLYRYGADEDAVVVSSVIFQLKNAKRLLKAEGVVYLRTDNVEYFEQMLEVFDGAAGFERTETPEPLKALVTDFEEQFNAQGIPTNYAAYRKVGG